MSEDDVHFVGIENYVLQSWLTRSASQKGGVCMYICSGVSFNYLNLS
jgi:hypothetical protein